MTQCKVKVKVTSPSKLELQPFSKAISFAIYNNNNKPIKSKDTEVLKRCRGTTHTMPAGS